MGLGLEHGHLITGIPSMSPEGGSMIPPETELKNSYVVSTLDRDTLLSIYDEERVLQSEHGHLQFPVDWAPEKKWHYSLMVQIAQWTTEPETRDHVVPPPPKIDLYDPDSIMNGVRANARYYSNYGDEATFIQEGTGQEIPKIIPLVAINGGRRPMGVLTIRGRGDTNKGNAEGIAGIERVITNPSFRNRGVATTLMNEAHNIVFNELGFNEVRLWVMQTAGMEKLLNFYSTKFGYAYVKGDPNWLAYARARNIDLEGDTRDAFWMYLSRENYFNKTAQEG